MRHGTQTRVRRAEETVRWDTMGTAMTRRAGIALGLIALAAVLCAGPLLARLPAGAVAAQSAAVPTFRVDPAWAWPPSLPGGQVVGVVSSVAVDRRDHVWVLHRARQVLPEVRERAAPPVLEFDAEGNFVQGWGGPAPGYDWPDTEHGLFVDHEDNVWITYVGDYGNSHIAVVDRRTLATVASFGERGGEPGNFRGLHALAVDSRGNLYTAETQPRPVGSRVQRFIYSGLSAAPAR